MIDTHVHVLDPVRFPYPLNAGGYTPRHGENGSLGELVKTMTEHGISHAVLVQPSAYGTDNSAILHALRRHPNTFRAVAMVPPHRRAIAGLADVPGVAGLRLNVTDYKHHGADTESLASILEMAGQSDLVVELLASATQISALREVLAKAECRIIIDHMGSPAIDAPADHLHQVMALGENSNIFVKLSAAFRYTAQTAPWADLHGHVNAIFQSFRPENLIWGSDWPFINLKGNPRPRYADVLAWLRDVAGGSRLAEMNANAARLFGFSFPEAHL